MTSDAGHALLRMHTSSWSPQPLAKLAQLPHAPPNLAGLLVGARGTPLDTEHDPKRAIMESDPYGHR